MDIYGSLLSPQSVFAANDRLVIGYGSSVGTNIVNLWPGGLIGVHCVTNMSRTATPSSTSTAEL